MDLKMPKHARGGVLEPGQGSGSKAEPKHARKEEARSARKNPTHSSVGHGDPGHGDPKRGDPAHAAPAHGEPKHKRTKRALIVVIVLLFVATVVELVLGVWKDPRAKKGYYEGKTPEEIQRDLDSQVDWYAMEISVAGAMQMTEGQTQVEARLENVDNNHCDQKVRMYLTNNPSDVLFSSGALSPGEYLQYVELAHPLPVGHHDVTVEFQGYERTPTLMSDEGQILGHDRFGASAAAEVTIDVLPSNVTYEDQ